MKIVSTLLLCSSFITSLQTMQQAACPDAQMCDQVKAIFEMAARKLSGPKEVRAQLQRLRQTNNILIAAQLPKTVQPTEILKAIKKARKEISQKSAPHFICIQQKYGSPDPVHSVTKKLIQEGILLVALAPTINNADA